MTAARIVGTIMLMVLGAAALTGCGGVRSGAGTPASGGPPAAPGCPPRAPSLRQPTVAESPGSGAFVASDPVAAQICGYEPGPRAVRATPRGASARTLALLLNDARRGRPRAPACTGGVTDVISLVYRPGILTVILQGCPGPVVASRDGRSWELSEAAGDAIGGGVFTLGAGDIPTPSFLGLRGVAATRAAEAFAPGSGAGVSGEIIDPQQPFGAVVWQEPLPGVGQTKPTEAGLLVAVAPEPPCAARQLAGRYLNGGSGTGDHFGNIVLLDISGRPCRMSGRITLSGLDHDGRPDTVSASETLQPPLVLSPHAVPRTLPTRPSGALAAIFGFSAEVRDDPSGHGACRGSFGFGLGSPFGLYS